MSLTLTRVQHQVLEHVGVTGSVGTLELRTQPERDALTELRHRGLLRVDDDGRFTITDAGRQFAPEPPAPVDRPVHGAVEISDVEVLEALDGRPIKEIARERGWSSNRMVAAVEAFVAEGAVERRDGVPVRVENEQPAAPATEKHMSPNEQRVIEYVGANPGARPADIRRALDLPKGTVSSTLSRLRNASAVVSDGGAYRVVEPTATATATATATEPASEADAADCDADDGDRTGECEGDAAPSGAPAEPCEHDGCDQPAGGFGIDGRCYCAAHDRKVAREYARLVEADLGRERERSLKAEQDRTDAISALKLVATSLGAQDAPDDLTILKLRIGQAMLNLRTAVGCAEDEGAVEAAKRMRKERDDATSGAFAAQGHLDDIAHVLAMHDYVDENTEPLTPGAVPEVLGGILDEHARWERERRELRDLLSPYGGTLPEAAANVARVAAATLAALGCTAAEVEDEFGAILLGLDATFGETLGQAVRRVVGGSRATLREGVGLVVALDALDRHESDYLEDPDVAAECRAILLADVRPASNAPERLVAARAAAVLASAEVLAALVVGPTWRTAGSPWEDRDEARAEFTREVGLFVSAVQNARIAREGVSRAAK